VIPSNVLGKSFVSSELIRIFAEKFVLFGKMLEMEESMPRWIARFEVFKNAVGRLKEIIDLREQRPLSQFECDSIVKRFEFTYEMAWKLMMSYEKDNGITELLGSKDVVRQAFAMSIIENGEAWLEMIDDRNKTSHLYDEEMAADVIDEIVHTYYPLFIELQRKMDQMASK
jgi:nucleotidyltransferase substrate binding protein (TIGR01987 family)